MKTLRFMTLNVAHGRRHAFHQALLRRPKLESNLKAIGEVLAREAPDVAALQEADGPSMWSGRFDHVEMISRLAGYPHVFRGVHVPKRLQKRLEKRLETGTAIISRLPIDETGSQAFDQSWRDNKGFVIGRIRSAHLGDRDIDVVSVHLDFLNPLVRARQVDRLIETFKGRDRPRIILGDFNCQWSGGNCLARLMERLDLHAHRHDVNHPTFPARKPRARIDWILLSQQLAFASCEVVGDQVSDHLAVIANVGFKKSADRHIVAA